MISELTVPLETNIETAHTQKQEVYSSLTQDMSDKKVKIIPFEIGPGATFHEQTR